MQIRSSIGFHVVESTQNRIDTKALKQEAPQTYERYLKQIVSRRFLVKKIAGIEEEERGCHRIRQWN